jgi:hypothetical protein
MKKSIYFFLVPVLALITFINCRSHYEMRENSNAKNLCISAFHQYEDSYSISVDRKINSKDKNAIRIKARDDASAMALPCLWVAIVNNLYYTQPFYSTYASPVSSHLFLWRKLRGPPVV